MPIFTAFQLDEGEFFSKCFGSSSKGSEFFPGEIEEMDSGDEFTPLASDVGPKSGETEDTPLNEETLSQPSDETIEKYVNPSVVETEKSETIPVDNSQLILESQPQHSVPLGVLRHTKDQLKLDLRPQPQPLQPVLADIRGEANILDSGIDTLSA